MKPRRSPSDLAKTAAVLNFDGIGTEIMGPIKSMVAYGAPLSSLGPMFFEVARAPAGR